MLRVHDEFENISLDCRVTVASAVVGSATQAKLRRILKAKEQLQRVVTIRGRIGGSVLWSRDGGTARHEFRILAHLRREKAQRESSYLPREDRRFVALSTRLQSSASHHASLPKGPPGSLKFPLLTQVKSVGSYVVGHHDFCLVLSKAAFELAQEVVDGLSFTENAQKEIPLGSAWFVDVEASRMIGWMARSKRAMGPAGRPAGPPIAGNEFTTENQ